VNDNAGPVDHRLNSARLQFFNCGAHKIENRCRVRDFFASAKNREFAADKIDNERARQVDFPE
jgi:hypothetical protein